MGVKIELKGMEELKVLPKVVIENTVQEGADILEKTLVEHTPVDTGLMKRSWTQLNYTKYHNTYYIEVVNFAQRVSQSDGWAFYSSFVNDGYHRVGGRFVVGQHFKEISEFIVQGKANDILERNIKRFAK